MADVEKVIKGLECCAGQCNYHGCPYKDPCENANGVKQIMLDALSLLKEQKGLVRCENCRYAEVSPSGLIKCRGIFRSKEWFCADGLRKEEE